MSSKAIKEIIIGILSVAASVWMWSGFAAITQHHGFAHILPWVWLAIALGLAEGFLFLLSLGRKPVVLVVVAILNALPILYFFGHGLWPAVATAVFAITNMLVMNFPAATESRTSGGHHHSAYRLSWAFALALVAFSAYLFAGMFNVNTATKDATNYFWPYVASNFAPFNSDQTVNVYLTGQAQQAGIAKPSSSIISDELQQFDQQVGFSVDGNEKMSDVGKSYAAMHIDSAISAAGLTNTNADYLLFLIFLILLPVIRLVITIGADVVVYTAREANLLQRGEKQITVETLEL